MPFFEVGYLPIILLIAIVVVAAKTLITVKQGFEYTLEKFGRYKRTLEPGLHFIMPFFEQVGRRINMMEQVLDVPRQEVISKDNAMLGVDAVVFFQVLDAAKAAYEVDNLRLAIVNLTMTNIRTVVGSMDLDETLSKRDEINHKLLRVVDEATSPWGIKVTRIEIKDIQPPADLIDSMARQMKAERDKRANILDAEGYRQAAILKAEGEKQSAVLEAEGRKEAAFRDAEARERLAEAEAKATQMVSKAISEGNTNALNYFVAQKYIESLKAFAESPNQKVFFMPMESTAILSSLGGIAELAKDAGLGARACRNDRVRSKPDVVALVDRRRDARDHRNLPAGRDRDLVRRGGRRRGRHPARGADAVAAAAGAVRRAGPGGHLHVAAVPAAGLRRERAAAAEPAQRPVRGAGVSAGGGHPGWQRQDPRGRFGLAGAGQRCAGGRARACHGGEWRDTEGGDLVGSGEIRDEDARESARWQGTRRCMPCVPMIRCCRRSASWRRTMSAPCWSCRARPSKGSFPSATTRARSC